MVGDGRSRGTKHTHFLIFPLLDTPFSTQLKTDRGVRNHWGGGGGAKNRRFQARGTSPELGDLHYLHPLVPRPAWLLPFPPRARTRFRAEQYIPAARRARPPPSFPSSPPPVEGPERAPAMNSPGTPLGAGGRARLPPPDPAPPHSAQAVASAAAESSAPSRAACCLPLLAWAVLPLPRPGPPLQVLEAPSHDGRSLSASTASLNAPSLDPNSTFRAQNHHPKLSLQRQLRLRRKCPAVCQFPSPTRVSGVLIAPKCQVPLSALTASLVVNCSHSH